MSEAAERPKLAEELRVFAQYRGDFDEEADAVIVGSGPCGAVATYAR